MAEYGRKSLKNLSSCDEGLIKIFSLVIPVFDNSIIEGHRTPEKQNELHKSGASKLRGDDPKAMHVYTPSKAVDVYPYSPKYGLITGHPRQIAAICDLSGRNEVLVTRYIWGQFHELRGHAMQAAHLLDIKLINGLDWNHDGDTLDHKFIDAMHYQLIA